jgi:lipid A ethanolaminephosphotransferase
MAMTGGTRSLHERLRGFEIRATVEQLALAASLYWLLLCNRPLFAAVFAGRDLGAASSWLLGISVAVLLLALHWLILLLVLNRWTARPLLALLFVITAFATFYIERFNIVLDSAMLRNVLQTHPAEARELLSPALLGHVLWQAGIPVLLLWRVRVIGLPPLRAGVRRLAALAIALVAAVAAVLVSFQPLSSLMRNQHAVRFMATPANVFWATSVALAAQTREAAKPRQPIGLDAAPGPTWAQATRPRLLVLVVGETARAANWGLSGYARQTTPQLAERNVINFRDVSACGTNTEVSVPCMFAPVGRRNYDETRIRSSESLLHVLARAGADVLWLDNQAGCKGVCEGLPTRAARDGAPAALCRDGHCLDEALLAGLGAYLDQTRGTRVLVLHTLGNHGPSYFRRYPPAFERFTPVCKFDDLARCALPDIANAYDNALLYTDHVLARLIDALARRADRLDSAMLFVSDHGESLGEKGLFLHGMPYRLAPEEQLKVPMVLWQTAGFASRAGVDETCLRKHATQPASHDHLFHTVLGLLDVRTALYERAWDLGAACRAATPRP